MAELLTAVRAVCNGQYHEASLPHVALRIDAFLWSGVSCWSLESASKRCFVSLMDRLLKLERPGYNRECRELRLRHALNECFSFDCDIRVLVWWLRIYMPDQQVCSLSYLLEVASERAKLPILEWLYQETKGDLPDVQTPVSCYDPDIVIWLYDHDASHVCSKLSLYGPWRPEISFQSIQRCFAYEEQENSFKIQGAEYLVANAIKRGELDALQWLFDNRPELFAQDSLDHAVHHGRLKVAKWMVQNFPPQFFLDPCRTMSNALYKGPVKYTFELVLWIVREYSWIDESKRQVWLNDAMMFAADQGELNMLGFIYESLLTDFMVNAGDVEVGHSTTLVFSPAIMEAAAANGHLSAVQWMHLKDFPCTPNAIDMAAKGGHLEMVQWLHENRSEGCSTYAMSYAAGHGHLEIVNWLHENRYEGCTAFAMDFAAEKGHLEIVQWLHENRSEGCSSDAMNFAAAYGHLTVVQFLHTHRQEGCTTFALERSAANDHFDTFRWLQQNRSEPFAPDLNYWESKDDGKIYKNVLKAQALCIEQDRLGWFVDQLIMLGDFEIVELLLSKACSTGLTVLESEFVDFL